MANQKKKKIKQTNKTPQTTDQMLHIKDFNQLFKNTKDMF